MTAPSVTAERVAETVARARRWLDRHVVKDGGEPELDEGDCTICGGAAGEGHEPTDPCGIVGDLLLALDAATAERKALTKRAKALSLDDAVKFAGDMENEIEERLRWFQIVAALQIDLQAAEAARDAAVARAETQQKELNGWREIGEELGRLVSLMPDDVWNEWFPDWFGPRLFDLQIKAASMSNPNSEAQP